MQTQIPWLLYVLATVSSLARRNHPQGILSPESTSLRPSLSLLFSAAPARLIGDVVLVVIASELHNDLKQAQRDTFLPAFEHVLFASEANTECVLCGDGKHYDHVDLFGQAPFLRRPVGWYCAQSRNLQGLRLAARAHPAAEWVVMIDDDTYLNAPVLFKMLASLDPSLPQVIGSEWAGGAGYAFSRGALSRLLATLPVRHMAWSAQEHAWTASPGVAPETVLDACIAAQLGGAWCDLHADWAIARCVRAAGMELEPASSMVMICPFNNPSAPTPPLTRHDADWLATCHHLNATNIRALHSFVIGKG